MENYHIKEVLSEFYLSAFGFASLSVHQHLQGKRNEFTLSSLEWAVFKKNILDRLENVNHTISSNQIKARLYVLCGSAIYITDPEALDTTLTSIKMILSGGTNFQKKCHKSITSEPNLKELIKQLNEWTAICSNRVRKRLPKGSIVSPMNFNVSTSNLEFITACLKSLIYDYSTHRICLLAITEYCKNAGVNYNLGFCSFLQRLVQCIINCRQTRVSFIPKMSKKNTEKITDNVKLKICGECSMPVNVYMKPKFANNNLATDDILETVLYNCNHMCTFSFSLNLYEEKHQDVFYRVYALNNHKIHMYTCPCFNPDCSKLIKDKRFSYDGVIYCSTIK